MKKAPLPKNGSGVFRPRSAQQAGSDIGQDGRQQQRAAGDNRNNAHHLLLLLRLLVGLRSHWNRPPIVEIKHIIAQSYASAKGGNAGKLAAVGFRAIWGAERLDFFRRAAYNKA